MLYQPYCYPFGCTTAPHPTTYYAVHSQWPAMFNFGKTNFDLCALLPALVRFSCLSSLFFRPDFWLCAFIVLHDKSMRPLQLTNTKTFFRCSSNLSSKWIWPIPLPFPVLPLHWWDGTNPTSRWVRAFSEAQTDRLSLQRNNRGDGMGTKTGVLTISLLDYWGGWACFTVSITMIGLLTAVIGDLASSFGCTVGLKDSVTAISFVALGTSLPGEFLAVRWLWKLWTRAVLPPRFGQILFGLGAEFTSGCTQREEHWSLTLVSSWMTVSFPRTMSSLFGAVVQCLCSLKTQHWTFQFLKKVLLWHKQSHSGMTWVESS